jgi:murein DD-endopeptidase MepM/ murein hydrolase activator NlpD
MKQTGAEPVQPGKTRGHGPAGHTLIKAIAGPGRKVLPLLLLLPGCFTARKELPQEAAPVEAAVIEAEFVQAGEEEEAPELIAGIGPGAAVPEAAPLRMALVPEEVRPGEPFALAFVAPGDRTDGKYRAVLLNHREERIAGAAFFSLPGDTPEVLAAVLAAPSTAPPGEARTLVERDGTALGELTLRITDREFASEEIVLDQRNTSIRTVPDPQKTLEAEQLAAIIHSTGTEVFAPGPFVPPVSSTRRTSFYGDRRVFRYATGGSATAIHAGVDYGVPTGTEVRACAAGKVALARFRISTGNSVVLEHLPGVYSLYYHLDAITVGEGDRVNAGDLVGKSGSTGLATGPHLHWEIRVSGENADPDTFLERALLDKKAIFDKLGR